MTLARDLLTVRRNLRAGRGGCPGVEARVHSAGALPRQAKVGSSWSAVVDIYMTLAARSHSERPVDRATAVLVLADGTTFSGSGLGAVGEAVGEVCFNTAMTGYQEVLTDPSYAGQIITFTFPHHRYSSHSIYIYIHI